ncbi:hypothetical protein K525DRAFT_266798 [Schizophyllum commune Loenen D]|nr:hypothetical protein K525DRAFT_266798 [Schizophyllum commune Loenen D]
MVTQEQLCLQGTRSPPSTCAAAEGAAASANGEAKKDGAVPDAGENARVWRVYLEESAQFDDEMISEFRDMLDVHLVFAALFSAVVSTFVLVALHRAKSPDDVAPSGIGLESLFYTTSDVWVNALWFTTLALSLATVLIAALVKQWLQEYVKTSAGPPRKRALVRHIRFTALLRWKVSFIIGLVPLLLHVSLALFFAGLAVFLRALHPLISTIVLVVTGLTYFFYLATHTIAVLFWKCSYQTPVTRAIRNLPRDIISAISHWCFLLTIHKINQYRRRHEGDQERDEVEMLANTADYQSAAGAVIALRRRFRQVYEFCIFWVSGQEEEAASGLNHSGTLDQKVIDVMSDSIVWLPVNCANPTAVDVAIKALAGWPAISSLPSVLGAAEWRSFVSVVLARLSQPHWHPEKALGERSLAKCEKFIRSVLCLAKVPWDMSPTGYSSSLLNAVCDDWGQHWAAILDRLGTTAGRPPFSMNPQLIDRFLCLRFEHDSDTNSLSYQLVFTPLRNITLNPSTTLVLSVWHGLLISAYDKKLLPTFLPEYTPSIDASRQASESTLPPSPVDDAPSDWLRAALHLIHICSTSAPLHRRDRGSGGYKMNLLTKYIVRAFHAKNWAGVLSHAVDQLCRASVAIEVWFAIECMTCANRSISVYSSQLSARWNNLDVERGGIPDDSLVEGELAQLEDDLEPFLALQNALRRDGAHRAAAYYILYKLLRPLRTALELGMKFSVIGHPEFLASVLELSDKHGVMRAIQEDDPTRHQVPAITEMSAKIRDEYKQEWQPEEDEGPLPYDEVVTMYLRAIVLVREGERRVEERAIAFPTLDNVRKLLERCQRQPPPSKDYFAALRLFYLRTGGDHIWDHLSVKSVNDLPACPDGDGDGHSKCSARLATGLIFWARARRWLARRYLQCDDAGKPLDEGDLQTVKLTLSEGPTQGEDTGRPRSEGVLTEQEAQPTTTDKAGSDVDVVEVSRATSFWTKLIDALDSSRRRAGE